MIAGGCLTLLIFILALAGPGIAPRDPLSLDLEHRLQKPDAEYLLGTDHLGRCVLSRILCGAGTSLLSAAAAVSYALLIGIPAGFVAGLGNRVADAVLTRICDAVLAFPFLILALALTAVTGPSLKSLILGVGMAAWAWWARFVRGMVLTAKEKDFVRQGFAMGLSQIRLIRRYILPQILPPLLVSISLSAGRMMVVISSLSYLGFGIQPPAPEWGIMLRESRLYLTSAPWLMMAPGIAVSISVLAFNLLGEGLKDWFGVRGSDPGLKQIPLTPYLVPRTRLRSSG